MNHFKMQRFKNLMKQNQCNKLKINSHKLTSHETQILILKLLNFQRYKLKLGLFRVLDAKNQEQKNEHP